MIHQLKPIGTIAYMGGIMSVPEPFAWDWGEMRAFTEKALCQENEFVHADRPSYSFHAMARNQILGRMLGDWLLMLDTDMRFDPDIAARLVRYMYAHDLDVVSGLYVFKGGMVKLPVLHMWNQETEKHEVIGDWDRSVDLFEFSSGGAGCLLVRRRVFQRIVDELKQLPFSIIPPYTEDHSFFRRLRTLGIKPYCAWKVACGHMRYEAEQLNPADNIREKYALNDFNVSAIRVGRA